jgi:hypothetical protein
MFLACSKSKVTIKLKFYYSNLKNAVETAKIAVDSCYVLRQFLTSLPSIDFREIRGLPSTIIKHLDEHKHICGADTFMHGTLESLPKFSGNVMMLDFS